MKAASGGCGHGWHPAWTAPVCHWTPSPTGSAAAVCNSTSSRPTAPEVSGRGPPEHRRTHPDRRPGVRRLIRPNAALPARGEVVAGLVTDFRRLAYRRSQAEEHRGGIQTCGCQAESDAVSWRITRRSAVPAILSRDLTWAIDRRGGGGCLISSESQIGTLLSLSGSSGMRAGCPAWGDVVAGISSRVVRPRLGYPRVASASD